MIKRKRCIFCKEDLEIGNGIQICKKILASGATQFYWWCDKCKCPALVAKFNLKLNFDFTEEEINNIKIFKDNRKRKNHD